MDREHLWAQVAVDRPLDRLFTYDVPVALADRVRPGCRVRVPFGRSMAKGVVIETTGAPPEGLVVKSIAAVLEESPLLTPDVIALLAWVSRYYACPLGEVIAACVPLGDTACRPNVLVRSAVPVEALQAHVARLSAKAPAQARLLAQLAGASAGLPRPLLLRNARAGQEALARLVAQGLLETGEDTTAGASGGVSCAGAPPAPPPRLSASQAAAIEQIHQACSSGGFAPFLLFGVTGSGKTEVYLQALSRVVAEGGQALVLLPEIALTPQTFNRVRARVPEVVLLHSLLSRGERAENMRRARDGRARVVVGARSAVFTPFADLRLIVVDEEHENSYKQENAPRYHARDVAVMRARECGIPIILGSATPSLESLHNARTGRYRMLTLPERVTPLGMPSIRVLDLTRIKTGASLLSRELMDLTAAALGAGRQAIFFLNRRGYARVVRCQRCGHVCRCPQCSVSVTYHHRGQMLLCHTCGSVAPRPEKCPACAAPVLKYTGAGTERVVRDLAARFPGVRIGRLDRDAASSRRSLLDVLDQFAAGRLDILVGTQMVAKGHDVPGVTLVGILCADASLYMPDFRAAERTFQLLHQVAGRAGRGTEPGTVVIQTYNPNNPVIRLAVEGDYKRFAEVELAQRGPLRYPPFGRMLRVVARGRVEEAAARWTEFAAGAVRAAGLLVLGPAPCTITRISHCYRYQLLVKGEGPARVAQALAVLKRLDVPRGIDVALDVDPVSFL